VERMCHRAFNIDSAARSSERLFVSGQTPASVGWRTFIAITALYQ